MKPVSITLLSLLILGAAGLAPEFAAAQQDETELGTFKDWRARTFKEGGKQVCDMFSEPSKSEGDYEKRGTVRVFVTHRPYANRLDEVSFRIGYTFKKGAPVAVNIGDTVYPLFSDGGSAWPRTSKEDRRLVRAMRAGSTMTVSAVSSHGTKTTDTFSLSGFTAAYNAIKKACKAR